MKHVQEQTCEIAYALYLRVKNVFGISNIKRLLIM